ncbi:MAG: hypothetical protein IJ240_00155 [Clostridia bacterium]|nr:hypothetical protein [Clostridia bacterium]
MNDIAKRRLEKLLEGLTALSGELDEVVALLEAEPEPEDETVDLVDEAADCLLAARECLENAL